MEIITTTEPHIKIADTIAKSILNQLGAGNKVLLLTAGGRAHKVYDELARLLNNNDLANLTVSLGDEHWSMNKEDDATSWSNFSDLNFWSVVIKNNGRVYDIIQGQGQDTDSDLFDTFLEEQISSGAYVISWQGMGADGHTAGILPNTKEEFSQIYLQNRYSVAHDQGGKTPLRVTITPKLIESTKEIYVYAVGEEKKEMLTKMRDLINDYPGELWEQNLHNYPVLYLALADSTIFTDQAITS
ncbi:6-phosphogluconolactonase [Candidatus Dojkabacteria bacterium]|uniref:6-phosphogluconolactonase n=1 Tax=Candidatus Dojkabacteria bacterium TaxID=2099670 RepID=A0A955L6D3_9BACT|nr:6-phosphogluconolactonase [Candidatus Dojkabacteria bacterium]